MSPTPNEEVQEAKKRKRERLVAIFFGIVFVVSTTLQAVLTGRRQDYGFLQSLLYFGLIHLNVILIMFLVFLVSRNLIKAYLLRRKGKLGSSLRWKMVSSLLAFSLFPSILLFVGSSYVIRQGFDRWFSGQVNKTLEDAESISDVHYQGIEKNLEFFSQRALEQIMAKRHEPSRADVENILHMFPVEGVEVYFDPISDPLRVRATGVEEWALPRAAVESLNRAFNNESFTLIRQYGAGDLVQRFAPFRKKPTISLPGIPGQLPVLTHVLVLSYTVPLGLKTRILDLKNSFAGYQKTQKLKEPLKANYTLVLLTLFILILFVVSWFGLYIAKGVTEPVSELMKATEAFGGGQWNYRIPKAANSKEGSSFGGDLDVLKGAFNLMAEEVGRRGRKLEEANGQLISLVRELEDRERYLETLLSSIRRGVLVLGADRKIQRINSEAFELSSAADFIKAEDVVGEDWRKIFTNLGSEEESRLWLEEAETLRGRPVDRIFEAKTGTGAKTTFRSVRATGIWLQDEKKQHPLGWLVIIEDVSDASRLERLAAWQEVARRVAHEIKNPLTPIQISADRLMRRMGARMGEDNVDGPIFQECLQQIQKQVRVIRDLVREFSQVAKLPEPQFVSVDLEDLLEQKINDYKFTFPQIQFHFENESPGQDVWVRADPEYMRRLVVNLIDNAIHSLEESKRKDAAIRVKMSLHAEQENVVCVSFEDNGPGVAPGLREKIFDPYISSKASGLGLGLPIVRRIAIEHMGRIRCEEASGGRFVLELPTIHVTESEKAQMEKAHV